MKTVIHGQRQRQCRGSLLLEASIAMGAAAILALLLMKSSLLSISGNQWASVQSLTDAALTKEEALARRVPFADLTSATSLWPDAAAGIPSTGKSVVIGKMTGGNALPGTITRFRVSATPTDDTEAGLSLWRLYSVLRYRVGQKEYVKSSSTLRVQ
ncbi:hypothetical protein [Verrucomicrobium sp. BvORR106]|uniref:hypothetical protein n=1 Tax=Verrucomicrobium sp. BvORR106 TaxID=1403819 RepID=UPI000570CFEC|nr:hypothetical protein [Verrucomicrobium sp. BvORR106]